MAVLHLLLLVFTAIQGCHGFQWTGGPEDNAVLYLCANENLTLPWDYVLSPGETAVTVEWYFHGRSEVLIAIFMRGHFLPEVGYLARVNLVPKAGIVISHVISGETGNFSVVISGHDSPGMSFTYRRTVIVQILDKGHLMTSDDQLHATVKAEAIYSNNTGLWSMELSCGKFTFLGGPPFDLEWVTPSDAVVPSTVYKDGAFHLHVQTGGNFVCRVPVQSAMRNCLPQPPPNASIHLDPVETRLTLMEHRQQQLQQDNERLKVRNQLLEQAVQTLQSKENQLEQTVQTLQSNDSRLEQLVQTLQANDSQLDQLVQELHNSTQQLSNASTPAQPIVFHAWLTRRSVTNLLMEHVETNVGDAYDSSTGRFTAPRPGLYYFAFSSTPGDIGYYSDGGIWKESLVDWICKVKSEVTGEQESCHAAVHLDAGDSVYAYARYMVEGQQTAFTGFLIAPDP